MKYITLERIIYITAFILLIMWFTQCQGEDETIVTPKKSGTFAPIVNPDPVTVVKYDTVYIKGEKILVPNKKNEELYQLFVQSINRELEAKDTIAKLKEDILQAEMYGNAIATNNYKNTFENGLISITIDSETEGKLKSIQPTWIIKPDTIVKKAKWKLYGGAEAGINTDMTKSAIKGNLMFQKGNFIYSGGYDTNETIWGGVNILLFQRK